MSLFRRCLRYGKTGQHANKFRSKNVRCMFVHAQNIFTNICCSMECYLIWPLCLPKIQLIQVKVAGEIWADH